MSDKWKILPRKIMIIYLLNTGISKNILKSPQLFFKNTSIAYN